MLSDDDFVRPNIHKAQRLQVHKKKQRVKKQWTHTLYCSSVKEFDQVLDAQIGRMMSLRTNEYTCNICPTNPLLHNMKRAYFKCDNTDCECAVEEPDCLCQKCSFQLKSEACEVSGKVRVQACGGHLSSCHKAKKNGLKSVVQEAIKRIKCQNKNPNFGPAQVRDSLLDHGFKEEQLPPVSKVTNFLNHQRNTSSTHHDLSAFERQLNEKVFANAVERYDAFIYGSSIQEDGTVNVGSGHENSHVNISFTSRALLDNVNNAQQLNNTSQWPMTFAIDFTFKTNLLGFYFGVMGVIDCMRHFFLGALTVISHKTTQDYVRCIGDFKDICQTVGGFTLAPFYCMLDGEAAIHQALSQLFDNVNKILMCYFHVIKNCKEHLKGIPPELRKSILRKIRGLHMSRNAVEFQVRLAAFSNYLLEHNLHNFLDYFVTTWVNSAHRFWRIFDTLPGIGSTNNAVEAFNKHFKSKFLNNKKYPLDLLLGCICWIIRFYSCKDTRFQTTFTPEASHNKRAQSLTAINALIGNCYYPNPYKVISNDDGTYTWVKGFPLPSNMHKTYVLSISCDGRDHCKCPVFLKNGYCKHLIATMNKFGLTSKMMGRGKFKNNTKQKKGRRPYNTPALHKDPTPMETAITEANVPTLVPTEDNYSEWPEGWLEGSDDSDASDCEGKLA